MGEGVKGYHDDKENDDDDDECDNDDDGDDIDDVGALWVNRRRSIGDTDQ